MTLLDWSEICKHVAQFTCTEQGKHLALDLTVPTSAHESIMLKDETLAAATLEYELRIQLDFGGISTDLVQEGLSRAKRGGLMSAEQLLAVMTLLRGVQGLRQNILGPTQRSIAPDVLRRLQPILAMWRGYSVPPGLVEAIDSTLDEEHQIRDSASVELQKARLRVERLRSQLKKLLTNVKGEITERSGRFCIAVSGEIPPRTLLLGSSIGGGVFYVEPRNAIQLNNDLIAAAGEVMTAEEAVLWKLTGLCVDSLHDLEYAARLVAGLDLALARAKYTSWVDGTLPEFVSMQPTSRSDGHEEGHGVQGTLMDKGQALTNGAAENSSSDGFLVRLERFRHPLLLGEFLLHRKKVLRRERMPGELFEEDDILRPPVAVDVRFRPQTKAVVITGSNTVAAGAHGCQSIAEAALMISLLIASLTGGGKTCSIKGVGLAALMARAGLGIPAEPPVLLPCYSAVLADIGDEQSLTSSLSTFSGHLARIQALRKEADGNCLVLLDEVGTGTDAEEGAALGAALLMELVKGGQGGALTVLATTHHAVLTTLAYRDPLSRFENASVEFDEERLVPTYRLLWGIPGRSNALEIGARLGMPHEIVEAAKARLGDGETGISAVIKQLEVVERQRRQGRDELRKFDLQVAKLKQDRDRLSYKVSGLQQQEHAAKRRMYSSILSEARTKLRQIRREQQLKSQLPASKRNVGATSTARREQKQTQSAARMKEQQAAKSREDLDAETEWDPRVGDVVYVPKLGSNARIVGTGPGEKLEVQAGSFMRLTVTKDAISRAK